MDRFIQLGVVSLRPSGAAPSLATNGSGWVPISADVIDALGQPERWTPDPDDRLDVIREACDLASAEDSELRLWTRRQGDSVLVRVGVQPSDGVAWRPKGKRVKLVRRLFNLLEKDFDAEGGGRMLRDSTDEKSTGMQDLYALIDSPPEPRFEPGEFHGDHEMFTALANYDNVPGVNTLMYKYQIRSVARMLQMECQPGTLLSPQYTPFTDIETGKPYYVDLKDMRFVRYPERFPLPQGGILCEQMGVGKTLMCLALVLASRHQPTRPPKGAVDISAVYTDVALREYSTASAAAMRDGIGISHENATGTPSLASMCADLITLHNPGAADTLQLTVSPSSQELLNNRVCLYYRFPPPPRLPRYAKIRAEVPPERWILAQTTIIVVPQILVDQWLAEAETHLAEGALKIYTLAKVGKKVPQLLPIEQLVRYDIILLSVEQWKKEAKRDEIGQYDTELMKARWKRLILDEGSNAYNLASLSTSLAKAMSVERRWIVSGTPGRHLKQGTEDAERSFLQFNPSASSRKINPWGNKDFEDVVRIGKMLQGFLSADLFQHDDFLRFVTKPLRHGGGHMNGPEVGSVDRIREIMSATMVKHRPGVINEETHVPPLSLSVQLVHFTHWQQLTYNALTALVVSNVYTSNFEDQDYFLHPRNTEAFNQVVTNLHLACLWFSSATMDLEGAITRNNTFLERKRPSKEHCDAVREANAHMQRALDSPGWAEWMRNETVSVPYEADMFPPAILDAWSEAADSQVPVIDAMALKLLRDLNEHGTSLAEIIRIGWDERAFHPQCKKLLQIMEREAKAWEEGRKTKSAAPDLSHHRLDRGAAADIPKIPKLPNKKEVKKKTPKAKAVAALIEKTEHLAHFDPSAPRPLPAIIRSSSHSTKINFVVRTILSSPITDKFVVFGVYDEIAHVQEALTLVGVQSVYVVRAMSGIERNRAIQDFAHHLNRVIFLDHKIAARGLTLVLANRMIFLSPIWNLDTQAQAIKRIHRIGQTRPTHVDILVTEGTFEEDIIQREASMRSVALEESYKRSLIENPRFVYSEDTDPAPFPIRLVPFGSNLNAHENEEYERLSAAVIPPSANASMATTPIVTPGSPQDAGVRIDPVSDPVSTTDTKRSFEHGKTATSADLQPTPATEGQNESRPKKRARFAD